MADVKISALPAATTPLAGTEVLPIVQSGTTDQVSVANLTAGRTVNGAAFTATGTVSGATLTASGTVSGATVNVGAGTVSAPSISPTGDSNTGVFFPAADTIAFTEGGVEAMRLDASGNVGIGTSLPLARLQADSSSATYSANIRARNSNFGNGVIGVASGVLTVATDTDNMAFYTASNLGVDGTSAPTNERMRLDNSGNLQFNSGYGSVATAFGCRAWVNFNGTGTVAIRGSGNVSSITDNGTGDYTVNFTNAMPDANYAISFAGDVNTGVSTNDARAVNFGAPATGSVRIFTGSNYVSPVGEDWALICLSVFR
jgi:hypothetical protein